LITQIRRASTSSKSAALLGCFIVPTGPCGIRVRRRSPSKR
jgi:hypothetical protein